MILSLTFIILILLFGFSGARSVYKENYPFAAEFDNAKILDSNHFNCESEQGWIYFVENDVIKCKGLVRGKENTSLKIDDVLITMENPNEKIRCNPGFCDYKLNMNGSIDLIRLRLSKEIRLYDVAISVLNYGNNQTDYLHLYINIKRVISVDDHYTLQERRIGVLIAIIFASLFSVFSAVSSLKEILKKENQ